MQYFIGLGIKVLAKNLPKNRICGIINNVLSMKGDINLMTKAELIASVAKKAEITQKDTEAVVNAFFSTVQETLAKGENVQVIGFGTFEVRERAARTGRNPQTGEELQIAAAKVPAFKAGKALKDAVNK